MDEFLSRNKKKKTIFARKNSDLYVVYVLSFPEYNRRFHRDLGYSEKMKRLGVSLDSTSLLIFNLWNEV